MCYSRDVVNFYGDRDRDMDLNIFRVSSFRKTRVPIRRAKKSYRYSYRDYVAQLAWLPVLESFYKDS